VLSRDGTVVAGTAVDLETWRPEQRAFTVELSQSSELILRLFNYPAWHANVNGHTVEIETADVTGQMVIPVPAGRNRVTIRFVRTPDRTIGIAMSLVSLIVLILLYRSTRAVTSEEAVGHS